MRSSKTNGHVQRSQEQIRGRHQLVVLSTEQTEGSRHCDAAPYSSPPSREPFQSLADVRQGHLLEVCEMSGKRRLCTAHTRSGHWPRRLELRLRSGLLTKFWREQSGWSDRSRSKRDCGSLN